MLDENELKIIIEKAVVSDAMTVYDLLNKKGIGNFINFILCSKYLFILILMIFRNKFRYTTGSFGVGMFL